MKLLPLFILILLTCCKPHSKQSLIVEEFKKVNAGIDSGNNAIPGKNSYEQNYQLVKQRANDNPQVFAYADSLNTAVKNANAYIDKLKNALITVDPSGERLGLADKLIVEGRAGDTLGILMEIALDRIMDASVSENANDLLSMNIGNLMFINATPGWRKNYFEKSPTVAAVTVLNAFKLYIESNAGIVMSDLADRLGKNK